MQEARTGPPSLNPFSATYSSSHFTSVPLKTGRAARNRSTATAVPTSYRPPAPQDAGTLSIANGYSEPNPETQGPLRPNWKAPSIPVTSQGGPSGEADSDRAPPSPIQPIPPLGHMAPNSGSGVGSGFEEQHLRADLSDAALTESGGGSESFQRGQSQQRLLEHGGPLAALPRPGNGATPGSRTSSPMLSPRALLLAGSPSKRPGMPPAFLNPAGKPALSPSGSEIVAACSVQH